MIEKGTVSWQTDRGTAVAEDEEQQQQQQEEEKGRRSEGKRAHLS